MMSKMMLLCSLAILWALLLVSTVTAQTSPPVVLNSCTSQYDCMFFTMERVVNSTNTCRGASCTYEVCMNIDYTRRSCTKGGVTSGSTINMTCPKTANASKCHVAPGFNATFATLQMGVTSGYRECQTVRNGNVAEFIVSDGGQCTNSLNRTLTNAGSTLISGLNVQCTPYSPNGTHQSCTGLPSNSDCWWRIRTPSSCYNGIVSTAAIQDEFDSAILRAQEATNRAMAASFAINITQLPKCTIADSFAYRNVTSSISRTKDLVNLANASLTNLTARSLSWTNTTGFSNGLDIALRAANDAETTLSIATLVADNYTVEKRTADMLLKAAYDQCLVANTSYATALTQIPLAADGTTVRTNVITQCGKVQSTLNSCTLSYQNIVTATMVSFNFANVTKEYSRILSFANDSVTQLNIIFNMISDYQGALQLANAAAAYAARGVQMCDQFEMDLNTSNVPSASDINVNTTPRLAKCNKTSSCLSEITNRINTARSRVRDAWRYANSSLAYANSGNVALCYRDYNSTLNSLNLTVSEINRGRSYANLPLDDPDPTVLPQNTKLQRVSDCNNFVSLATNEAGRCGRIANNASTITQGMTFDQYRVQASSLTQQAFKLGDQCSAIIQAAMAACGNDDADPMTARRAWESCRSLGDNADYLASQTAVILDTQKTAAAMTASQRNQQSASDVQRQKQIDDAMKVADDSFAQVQNILTQSFALQMNCTDSATKDILVRVTNAAYKTAGQRKRTSDLALQGLSDDCVRSSTDVANSAADTQKLLDDAKTSCDLARRAKERDEAARSSSLSLLPKDCATYKEFMLDFDDAVAGQYITDYYKDTFNVMISATGGFSPANQTNAARIFDSANPSPADLDLGSPNAECGTGGKGIGVGGKPTAPYPNCAPLNKILIIQKTDSPIPDDNEGGGVITFTFAAPVIIDSIGLMDLDDVNKLPMVNVYTTDSTKPIQFATTFTGDNGLFPLSIKTSGVTKVEIRFGGSGAVTFVRYLQCLARKTDDLYIADSDRLGTKATGRKSDDGEDEGDDEDEGEGEGGGRTSRSGPVVGCLQDKYSGARLPGNLVCGKKNAFFEKVAATSRGTCVAGQTTKVSLKGSLTLRTSRYDIGWYIATDGGEALKGSCVLSILDQSKQYSVVGGPNSTNVVGVVQWDNDLKPNTLDKNDACGDVFIKGGSGTIDLNDLLVNQNVQCVDKNDDGSLDIAICITFRAPGQDDKCDPAGPYPGDANTCYCSRYNIPQISVTKPTVSTKKC